MRNLHLLYAGDSPAGGPANYLLALIAGLGDVRLTHVPPGRKLKPSLLARSYDGFIFSDFSRGDVPLASEKAVAEQVNNGAGLLMVGGWGSFSGPFGSWKGSLIEDLLPVRCQKNDDRINLAEGLLIREARRHPMFRGLNFDDSPVLIGLNAVKARKESVTILEALPMKNKKGKVSVSSRGYPLLVLHADPARRTAALTTDLAPHWCGGWVDWGKRRLKLPVTDAFGVEVGHKYAAFGQSLLRWLLDS
ncbi:MAG: hypothetical protein FGM27_06130 [Candidatus Omnitrophica bacterium]|nr:hypothetical protein [Candidatus Omnitrophota bacterium]